MSTRAVLTIKMADGSITTLFGTGDDKFSWDITEHGDLIVKDKNRCIAIAAGQWIRADTEIVPDDAGSTH